MKNSDCVNRKTVVALLLFMVFSSTNSQQNVNSINNNIYTDPPQGTWKVNYNGSSFIYTGTWDSEFSKNVTGSVADSYFKNISSYNSTTYNYTPPQGSLNVCVTVQDLQFFGYIDQNNPIQSKNFQPWNKVTPENFCYEYIYYNISHPDLNNWVDNNLDAYMMYKRTMAIYRVENYTGNYNIPDNCLGIIKAMYCFYNFPFCRDLGNYSWYEEGICSSWCDLYQIRCADVNPN